MEFLRENKIILIIIAFFCILTIALLLIVISLNPSSPAFTQTSFIEKIASSIGVTTEKENIVLESQVPGKSLSWANEKGLNDIVNEFKVFTDGVRDPVTGNMDNINSIKIVYTPTVQKTYTNVSPDNNILYSGSGNVSDKTLTIMVYMNDNLFTNKNDIDIAFNQKVIQVLVQMSVDAGNNVPNQDPTSWMNYIFGIYNEHFGSDNTHLVQPYPIKIT